VSQVEFKIKAMDSTPVQEAVTWLEKANADLEPELLSAEDGRVLLAVYARAVKLASYGQTAIARKLDDARRGSHASGVSMARRRPP
jgi:hypothetical protein